MYANGSPLQHGVLYVGVVRKSDLYVHFCQPRGHPQEEPQAAQKTARAHAPHAATKLPS
jgi:hypothetical protein